MGVSASAISRVTGVDVSYKNFNVGRSHMLPQRLAIIGVGNDDATYDLKKYEISSASAVGAKYGYGSPLHLAARQLFPLTGAAAEFPVTVYPLIKAATAVVAEGAIGVSGTVMTTGTGTVYIGGITVQFVAVKGDTANTILTKIKDAVNASLECPARAGDIADGSLPLTAKWAGASGNRITFQADTPPEGLILELTAFAGGVLDPDVSPALAAIGPVWETFILNTFDYNDPSRLDKYQEFADGRWNVLEKKGCLVAHGCTDSLEVRTAVTDIRKNDKRNFLIVSVGSRELPFIVAAKGLISDIMTTANSNPPQGYKGLLAGLHTGGDEVQENYTQRNSSVTKGSSTNIKNGSVAELNDIITFFHPDSEGKYPSYRYVVDAVKLMNVVYNVRLIMEADEMKGAPLLPDNTPTVNPAAVAPKTVKTSFYNLATNLALNAILSEPEFTQKNMTVAIDSENPKRLNVVFPVKLSGNVEVGSTDIYFGFYLGGA